MVDLRDSPQGKRFDSRRKLRHARCIWGGRVRSTEEQLLGRLAKSRRLLEGNVVESADVWGKYRGKRKASQGRTRPISLKTGNKADTLRNLGGTHHRMTVT